MQQHCNNIATTFKQHRKNIAKTLQQHCNSIATTLEHHWNVYCLKFKTKNCTTRALLVQIALQTSYDDGTTKIAPSTNKNVNFGKYSRIFKKIRIGF